MKKGTYLINHLKSEPLRYSDMQRLLKSLRKTNNGWELNPKYNDDKWKERKDYQGYWCTNLSFIKGGRFPMIKKGDDGKYMVTEHGLKNIEHPFSHTEEELTIIRERQAEYDRRRAEWEERKRKITPRFLKVKVFENEDVILYKKIAINGREIVEAYND
tara:strand:+ start:36 stop:512 length:477 start_codon:yes stop_codon:yes gene_type:complete